MTIPESIKIGGFDWNIKRDINVTSEGNVFGSAHYKSQSIFIEPEPFCTKQKAEQCLLHETIHAIFWQTGLNQRINNINKDLEEEIVSALAHGLYQVLKDNKLSFGD